MSVVITVRDAPDDVRDELGGRAARAGKSLPEYLRAMFIDSAARPTVEDVVARAARAWPQPGCEPTRSRSSMRGTPTEDEYRRRL